MTLFERTKIALARQKAEEDKVVVRKSNTDQEIMGLYSIAEIIEFYDYNCSEIHAAAGDIMFALVTKTRLLKP